MIQNHIVEYAVRDKSTRNYGGEIKPKFLILYGTNLTLQELMEDFSEREDIKESAHLIIDHDGTIHQIMPLNCKAWHAGASYWQGHHGLNGSSIGIFVVLDYGRLSQHSLNSLHRLIPDIVVEYNIRGIVPHSRPGTEPLDITPFRPYVEYGNADSVGRFITTANIDIFGGPNVDFTILDSLKAGDTVKILRYSKDGEWAFILFERGDHTPRYGWTHESLLRRI